MQAVSPTMKKPAYLNDRRAMGLSDRKISLATGKTVPLFRLIFFSIFARSSLFGLFEQG